LKRATLKNVKYILSISILEENNFINTRVMSMLMYYTRVW